MSIWEKIAMVAGILSLPSVLLWYWEQTRKWGPRLSKVQRPLGVVLLLIAGVAYIVDIADRVGAFGATKSELEQQLVQLESKRALLQGESDYRRIVIQGADGRSGMRKRIAVLATEVGKLQELTSPPSLNELIRRKNLIAKLIRQYGTIHPSADPQLVERWVNSKLEEKGEPFRYTVLSRVATTPVQARNLPHAQAQPTSASGCVRGAIIKIVNSKDGTVSGVTADHVGGDVVCLDNSEGTKINDVKGTHVNEGQ